MDYSAARFADPIVEAIDKYDLYRHVVELEAYGMTVVPPETLGVTPAFVDRLRGAILRTCEHRNQMTFGDITVEAPPAESVERQSWDLLGEDEVFIETATNPVQLALVRWLLGGSAVFSGSTWIIKGRDNRSLPLHSDAHGIPPGAGQIAHMCNASWLCTDYEGVEDGPTVFVPGSHKYGRATLPHEVDLETTPFKTVPLIGKAGSLALWHGATWHASVPRTKPGLRVTLVQNYMRSYMRPQHVYEGELPAESLAKYPELEKLIGQPLYPYRNPRGPDRSRISPFIRTGTDQFA